LLSPKWIEESTKKHSSWGELSYSYLWWINNGNEKNCFATIGDGGNIIYVNPEKIIVIAITSQFMSRAKDRIELIKKTFYHK